MNVRSTLSVAAIVCSMAFPGVALGQDEHMISGKAVPADQITEVQAKCDELRTAATTDAAASTETTVTPSTTSTSEGWLEDGTKIDLDKLTIALCDEGKFAAPA